MADTELSSHETPEDVLESEIADLEKRTLNSAWLWAAAAVGLIVLFSAAFFFASWDRDQSNARLQPIVPQTMSLREPSGSVDRNFTFRWLRVDGAASYILSVTAAGSDEVELLRPVRETYLRPSETELANMTAGSYTWTIEARSSRGQLIGYGQGAFSLAE
jgi:hypothetical protein